MSAPTILLIDDDPQVGQLTKGATVMSANPRDENFGVDLLGPIKAADLILLDQNLHLKAPQGLGLNATDGASMIGILRSLARTQDVVLPPLAIYTSEDEAFKDETPSLGAATPLNGSFVGHEARIAPTLDVEWLISKKADTATAIAVALAQAARDLKTLSKDGRLGLEELVAGLALPTQEPWADNARSSLARWRPPISEATSGSVSARGVSGVLRWLLHQALPWPGLLISKPYVTWSIGLVEDGLDQAIANGSELSVMLETARYTGIGSDLYPQRWWAAGIDFIGWMLRDRTYGAKDKQAAFEALAGPGVARRTASEDVVVVNSDLEPEGFASIEDAVEIFPPGWPPEALRPWMRRDEVKGDQAARTMVDPAELADLG